MVGSRNGGQNVSRRALFLSVDMVRAMWMAYGKLGAAKSALGGLGLVTEDTMNRQGVNSRFQPPG